MGQGFPNVNSFLIMDSFDTYHVGTIMTFLGFEKWYFNEPTIRGILLQFIYSS